ncbi:MAG: hypothetical protein QME66_09765 [Candidatus Eisenbacteria bacterium]|nr:hypothetical protein [Candidatus Eisenbacteria bacterium]
MGKTCGTNLEAVFLTGSLSLGEGSSLRIGDRVLLLSDLDLGVVTSGEKERRELVPILREIESSFSPPDPRLILSSPLSLPVYTRKDIRSQKPKMETVDMANQGKVLAGDESCLSQLPITDGSEITKVEAITLVENRAWECLRNLERFRPSAGPESVKTAFLAGKAILDCMTSILAFRGAYVPGYKRRLSVFKETLRSGDGEIGGIAPGLEEEATFWAGFREKPEISIVRKRYGEMGTVLSRARELMRQVWLWECSSLSGAGTHELSALIFRTAARPGLRENARALRKALESFIGGSGSIPDIVRVFRLSRWGNGEDFLRKMAALLFFELPESRLEDWECSAGFMKLARKVFSQATVKRTGRSGKVWVEFFSGSMKQ